MADSLNRLDCSGASGVRNSRFQTIGEHQHVNPKAQNRKQSHLVPAMDRSRGGLLSRGLDEVYGETIRVLRIICVALRISLMKWNLSLPVIATVFLLSSLISLSQLLLDKPLSIRSKFNLVSKDNSNALVLADFGTLLAQSALDLFRVTTVVHGVSAAYREPQPLLKDLLRRIRRDWEGPVVAQLCASILRAGYWHLLGLFSGALLPLMAGPTSFLLLASWILVVISGSLFFYYLDAAWATSAAAAAVDDCGGLRAVALAAEMTARRRRLPGMILLLIFRGFSEAFSRIVKQAMSWGSPGGVQDSIFVLFGNLSELLRMLELSALTVFYCRCRRSAPTEDGRGPYSRLDGPLR